MKRIIIIPVALLLSVAAFAQQPVRKAISIGPVIGFGHAWMSPVANSEYNPGMSAGLFGIYAPNEHWGLGMDVRYSIEGSKKDIPEVGFVNQKYQYLRVPVRAMYFFGKWGDDFRPKVTLGPSMGFLLAHDGPVYTTESKFDFGVAATGGFNYRIYRGTWLNADLGYYHGFTDAIMHTSNREMHRNLMLNIGVGLEI